MARLFACLLVVLLGLSDVAVAQTPRARSQQVDPLTSNISGRVTTSDTGAPIRGAEVRLSIDGRFSRLVTTNSEGRYELRSLPAGTYKLTASKTGFITLEFGQRRAFETSSTITVREGEAAVGNIALLRGGVILGRVLDPFGDPTVGARVQVLRLRLEDGSRRLIPVGAPDQTDDMGTFRVYGLPAGEYYVTVSTGLIDALKRDPPVFYPGTMTFADAQPIALGAGGEASADFQLVDTLRTATVSGVVLTSSGAPAAGAMVNLSANTMSTASGAAGASMLHGDAAADGSFTLRNVPPGAYTLNAQLPFAMDDQGPITGRFNASKEDVREQMLNGMPETTSIQLNVGSENLSGIALTTRPGGRVNGRFVADTGVTRPLPTNLGVALRGIGPGNRALQMGSASAADFVIAGMSGPARIDVEGVPDGWAVKAILVDGNDVTDSTFDLSGRTGTLRIVMTDRATSLSGAVQSTNDRRSYPVVVFSDDATKWRTPSRFVRAVRADADGNFRFRGLPPGERYLVAAVEYLETGEEQDRQLLDRLRIRATSVTLGDGEQRTVQLDVISR